MDGSKESKTFAPGYGEFYTSGGGDVEALALAVPTDAASEPLPAELRELENRWTTVFEATRARTWSTASVAVKRMAAAWTAYKVRGVPRRIEPRITHVLERLADAVRARYAGRPPICDRHRSVDPRSAALLPAPDRDRHGSLRSLARSTHRRRRARARSTATSLSLITSGIASIMSSTRPRSCASIRNSKIFKAQSETVTWRRRRRWLRASETLLRGRHFEPTPHRGCYPWLLSTTQKMFPSVSARTMKSEDSG